MLSKDSALSDDSEYFDVDKLEINQEQKPLFDIILRQALGVKKVSSRPLGSSHDQDFED